MYRHGAHRYRHGAHRVMHGAHRVMHGAHRCGHTGLGSHVTSGQGVSWLPRTKL